MEINVIQKLSILIAILLTNRADCQVLSIDIGQMFYKSKTITPVLFQTNDRDNQEYYSLMFSYPLPKSKFEVGGLFGYYRGWSYFTLDTDYWLGNGSSATDITRFGVFCGRKIGNKSGKVSVSPQISLFLERSIVTGSAGVRAYIDNSLGPNFEGPIILEAFNNTQIIPALGLDIDWNFFWRLHLHANAYYAWGHKPFQKYYFEYTYDGVQQPTAEWHSDGTGLFTTIGLGFQLWGFRKKNQNQDENRMK